MWSSPRMLQPNELIAVEAFVKLLGGILEKTRSIAADQRNCRNATDQDQGEHDCVFDGGGSVFITDKSPDSFHWRSTLYESHDA